MSKLNTRPFLPVETASRLLNVGFSARPNRIQQIKALAEGFKFPAESFIVAVQSEVTRRYSRFRNRRPTELGRVLDCLIEIGLDINASVYAPGGFFRETVLEFALFNNFNYREDIAEMLLKRGADANKSSRQNTTPLHRATARKKTSIMRLLIKYGAGVNKKDDENMTPLFRAVGNVDPESVEILLKSGAHTNIQSRRYKSTVLHLLSQMRLIRRHTRQSFMKTLRLLLRAGANPTIRDSYGTTAKDLVASHEDSNLKRATLQLIDEMYYAPRRVPVRNYLNVAGVPDDIVQKILHAANVTNINEYQGRARNEQQRRNQSIAHKEWLKRKSRKRRRS